MSGNRLAEETSPYLQQHKDNPVHWRAWGADALADAKREDKPILLSVGYAACHWCHVMAHESFEDPAVAALMNDLYVNIKVDREERPDLDGIYQSALALLGQQGGWPLTMFLTPEGRPFWGGTYFPPEPRWGRPSFRQVLETIAGIYRGEPDKVAQNVEALGEALGRLSAPGDAVSLSPAMLDQVVQHFTGDMDRENGGIGGAPKFPHCSIFELLWRGWKRSGDTAARDAVLLTLDRMSQGGIYDHLGGGFARYSVDARWLAPHFEKMLYDNAQLVELLTLVWQETRAPLYEARIRETVAWLLREMRAEAGKTGKRGFASSLDADSEGEEGRFYVWDEAEIDAALGADAAPFKAAYDVTPGGNWEGHTILNRLERPALGSPAEEAALAANRKTLFDRRARRPRPGWDDKVLADWNGMMIAALALAGQALDELAWIERAVEAFDFVVSDMAAGNGEAGRLHHAWRAGKAAHRALLEDYAMMSRAALGLAEATGDPSYVQRAEDWVALLERHYWDAENGGYFTTADDADDLIHRPRDARDNAVPSGNGVMVGVLARLHHLTGKPAYRQRAQAILDAFSGELRRNLFPLATLLNSAELLESALQIVIVGERDAAGTRALRRAVDQASLPNRILSVVADPATLPSGHPASGKAAKGGKATAFICRGQTCSLPITDAAALARGLAEE
jgi:uncharacterized protein YyaL (SSP411 family)